KAVSFVEFLVAHGSILTILAISVERFYAICRPLQAGYKCTKRRAIIIIACIWIISSLSSIPLLFITELLTVEYIDGTFVSTCVNTLKSSWHPTYYVTIFVLFFCLPFLVLVYIYIIIAKKLVADSHNLITSTRVKKQNKIRRQVVIMLASVCFTFFTCLLPFRLMTLWILLTSSEAIANVGMENYYTYLYICRIMLYFNSSINPILYNVISTKFRKGFCHALHLNARQKPNNCSQSNTLSLSFLKYDRNSPLLNVANKKINKCNEEISEV
ncbi:growth hormone secretagogue receptor type 1-like protein, partial [Dinothrombium tinctorium]